MQCMYHVNPNPEPNPNPNPNLNLTLTLTRLADETGAIARHVSARVTSKKRNRLGLKVPCAPKWFDSEFPISKTTKL